ncbi:MAG: hydrogenase maturation protease [Candidatus Hodarchaeales archaeon]
MVVKVENKVKKIIFGVGNKYRQDDGIGLAILERIRNNPLILAEVDRLIELNLSVFDIEAILKKYNDIELAIIIDAASSKRLDNGTILLLNLDDFLDDETAFTTTTHGITIVDILKMMKEFQPNILPRQIIIIGIIVPKIGYGQELSSIAQESIPRVENIIMDILRGKKLPKILTHQPE